MNLADGSVKQAAAECTVIEGVTVITVSAKSDCAAISPDLGVTVGLFAEFDRATAVYRHSEYWCKPRFVSRADEIPDETQLLITQCATEFTVCLPIVSELYRVVLCYRDGLSVKAFSQSDRLYECRCPVMVYASGADPFALIEKCYRVALDFMKSPVKLREQREYPEIFEYLGWCSWDAMQIRVNEPGLIAKCREFNEKDIPVRWAIIDDMWADVPAFLTGKYSNRDEMINLMHSSTLASFSAAPDRFPEGLEHTVAEMKKYIDSVGIWHPTTGYWFGISNDTPLYEKYKENMITLDDGRIVPRPTHKDFYKFFHDFHEYLHDCGADFVKVDNQSIIRKHYKNLAPIGSIARELHRAIEDSVDEFFGGAVINCMGCASDNIWNRPHSAVSRCSDDFLPENADWFTKHILQCSFMSFMQGPLIWSDWDMWWSDDGQAVKNGVLRAISGGPVYVSDEIGRSRADAIAPICLKNGKILRADRPAMPACDCLTVDPTAEGVFKVQNTAGGAGALAVFSLHDGDAVGTISPGDVYGLRGSRFAVREYFSGQMFVMDAEERREIVLSDRKECKLFIFVEIKDEFACFGAVDKYMSPLTVVHADRDKVELKESGYYAYYDGGKFYEKYCEVNDNE